MAAWTPRVALFGPARSRVGTGPFLARWFERAACPVVACAGRDLERTQAAAAELDRLLGEEFEGRPATRAFAGCIEMLERVQPDVLAIATPMEAHEFGMRAALDTGCVRAVLCEKPLVQPERLDGVPELLDRFLEQGVLLVESCQWPEVLRPAFSGVWPGLLDAVDAGRVQRVAMGLAPSGRGLSMVVDSLSHLLSVVQALLPIDRTTQLRAIEWQDLGTAGQELRFGVAGPFSPVEVRLVLRQAKVQPRPAWIAIDGHRVDRLIRRRDYGFGFVAGRGEKPDPAADVAFDDWRDVGREVWSVDDPLGRLVYRFRDSVQAHSGKLAGTPDQDLVRDESERIRQRARLFRTIIESRLS